MFLFFSAYCPVLLLTVSLIGAQQEGKVYRIGYLGGRSGSPATDPRHIAFRQRLRELGYVEGQNVAIEYRYAGKHERPLGDLAADLGVELVRLKVDVIVASASPPVIRAAQGATRAIPIVMLGSVVDPVAAEFVVSLARPGGNITGLTNLGSNLHAKRLELLKEAFPRISRVAILWPPPQQKHAMKEVETAGQALGIQIQSLVVTARRPSTLDSAFSAISQERPEGLMVATSGLIILHRARIIELAAKRRLPSISHRKHFAEAGGLLAYGSSLAGMWCRAATHVDKILKGTKPGDIPV